MRRVVMMLVVLMVVVGFAAPAGAKDTAAQKKAKATAQGLVAAYLPSSGTAGLCEVQSEQRWAPGHKSYLDSCSTSDGSFRFVVLVNAARVFKPAAALKQVAPDIAQICGAGGVALSTGVKGRFLELHLGTGAGIASANASKAIADGQESQTPGYSSSALC